MQLKLRFSIRAGELTLPLNYNELLQGFIYRHLEADLAARLHDEGFPDPCGRRKLKLFTFSRLLGRWKRSGDRIAFLEAVELVVASPWDEFVASLSTNLLSAEELRLNGQEVFLEELRVEPVPEYRESVTVKTLSPVTIYSTLFGPGGRKKTYYYNPFEEEFSELLVRNLARKARVWYGKEVEAEGEIRPVKVSKRDEHVLMYKGTVIKAWSGIYELRLPEELFRMAFAAGLGAKNSQGFGCIEVWRPTSKGSRGQGPRRGGEWDA